MTAFKKLTAYSDVKCEWVSPTYPYDEENAKLQAENAKLRETLQRRSEQLDGMIEMWVERGVENAKLRELASGIGHLLFSLDVDYCAACPRDGVNHPCPVHTACGGECLYKTDLRELGVDA